eukprot:5959394-Alexandrium_andersonii.AAC.2
MMLQDGTRPSLQVGSHPGKARCREHRRHLLVVDWRHEWQQLVRAPMVRAGEGRIIDQLHLRGEAGEPRDLRPSALRCQESNAGRVHIQCQSGRTNASAPLASNGRSERLATAARGRRGASSAREALKHWQHRQLPPGLSALHLEQLVEERALQRTAHTHVAMKFPGLGRNIGQVQANAIVDADELDAAKVVEGCGQRPLLTVQGREARIDHDARSNERHAENTAGLSERVQGARSHIQAVADPRVIAAYVQAGLGIDADAARVSEASVFQWNSGPQQPNDNKGRRARNNLR